MQIPLKLANGSKAELFDSFRRILGGNLRNTRDDHHHVIVFHWHFLSAFLHVIFICTGVPKGSPEQRVGERLGSDLYKKALKEPKLSKRFWTQGSQI